MTSSIMETATVSVGSYLNDLKKTTVLWDDVTYKANKFDQSLKIMSQSSNNVADSIRRLCGPRAHNFAGLSEVTQLLSEVTATQRCLGHKMSILSKVVQNNLVVNLSTEIEPWRRSISTLKKERNMKGKKAKIDYKKSLAVVTKLEKKINKQSDRKQSLSDTMSVQVDYASQDLQNKEHFIDELDRCVLRKAISEERTRYRILIESLRPVLEAQLSMRDDLDQLQRIYTDLYSTSHFNLNMIPSEVESYVQQFQVSDRSRSNSFCSMYSRTNSQQSLGGSSCSSPLHSLNQPQYFQDNLDTSSSTLRDKYNEFDGDKDDNVSEDDADHRCSSTRIDTMVSPTTLYPNQALPAPRYSNLRQLKQNAEKKYGFTILNPHMPGSQEDTHDFAWNVPAQSNGNTLPRNIPSSRGDYCTLPRKVSSLDEAALLSQNVSSHYNDCTFHLNAYAPSFSDGTLTKSHVKHASKENDIYSSISQIYGTPSLFSESTSGTSTFKRRKPSNVTSMEVPTVIDKGIIYQALPSETSYQMKNKDFRSNFNPNVNKNNSALSQLRYSADLSSLSGYSHGRSSHQPAMNEDLTKDLAVTRRSSKEDDPSLNEVPHSGSRHNDIMPFKQQLLRVMQTSRPYSKPMSPISSDIF